MSRPDGQFQMQRAILEGLLEELRKQHDALNEQAVDPFKSIAQSGIDSVWRGVGAEVFVDEVSSLVIPSLYNIQDQLLAIRSGLLLARDILDQADNEISLKIAPRIAEALDFY